MVVPKIIHQIWINQNNYQNKFWAQEKFKKSILGWKNKHPDFKYIFWSNIEIYNMISNFFPELIEKIQKINDNDIIILADISRLCILYIYGGIYSDLDIVPHINYSSLLNTNKIIFPKTKPFGFSNDLIISPKKNKLLKKIIDSVDIKNYIPIRGLKILYSCGPLYITEHLFKSNQDFYILPNEYYKGHLDGSTWLSENDHILKKLLTDCYHTFENDKLNWNFLNEVKENIIVKKNLVSIYEHIDSFIIFYFMLNPDYIDKYYIFRLLDIFKSSNNSKIKKINTIIHAFYRVWGTRYLNKKSDMYLWMRDLSLVSLTEMKSIKTDNNLSVFITVYVLIKHLYIIIKTFVNKKRLSPKISNNKTLLIHLFESSLHFFFLTDRNTYLKKLIE